jgi:hypothetical protein
VQPRHVELALVAPEIVGLRRIVGGDRRRSSVARLVALDRVAAHIDEPIHRPAAEEIGAAEPSVEANLDAVVGAAPHVRIRRVEVGAVHVPALRRVEVVDRQDRPVERADDGHDRVVGGRPAVVLGTALVVDAAAVVAGVHREALRELVLDRHGVLEVVFPLDVRIGPQRLHRQAKRRVVARPDLAVLRDVVAVGVAPGPGIVLELQRVVAGRETGGLARHVAAERRLQRGLGVAEQVVGHAEPWGDVEPAGHAGHLRERALRREAASAHGLVLDLRGEALEPRAHVQRHAIQRPGILDEHADVAVEVLVPPHRRVVDADLVGHAVAIELHQITVDVVLQHVVAERPVHAGLQGVAARHVRQLAGDVVRFRVDAIGGGDAAVVGLQREHVALAGVREPARRVALLLHARLVADVEIFDVGGKAGLQQQLAAERRGPFRLAGEIDRMAGIATARGRVPFRDAADDDFVSLELRVAVVIRADLVLLVQLPGKANHVVHDPLVFHTGAHLARIREVAARDDRVGGDAAIAGEEPQLVPHDGPAHADVDVGDLRHAGSRAQTSVPELVGHVVGLPVAVGAADEGLSAEDVAPVLGNEVDPDATGRDVRGDAARLVGGLRHRGVAVVRLDLAVVHQAVQVHPVDLQRRVGLAGAVDGHVDLFHLLVAADVGVAHPDALDERGHAAVVARRRHRVHQLAVHDDALLRVLDVDDRTGAGDGDRFLERPDPHVGIHGRREVGGELESVLAKRIEPGQRERDAVNARSQIDDGVSSLLIAHGRADLFDQHRAGHFHSDTRHDGAAAIANRTADRALRQRGSREQQQTHHCGCTNSPPP